MQALNSTGSLEVTYGRAGADLTTPGVRKGNCQTRQAGKGTGYLAGWVWTADEACEAGTWGQGTGQDQAGAASGWKGPWTPACGPASQLPGSTVTATSSHET